MDNIRNDCASCGRERSAKDDNHAPDCPYWHFFGDMDLPCPCRRCKEDDDR